MGDKTEIRTARQNNSLHLLFENIATEMEEQGIPLKVLMEDYEIFANPKNIKSIFRKTGEALFEKKSTAELTKEEFSETLKLFLENLAKIGIVGNLPSQEFNNLVESYNLNK